MLQTHNACIGPPSTNIYIMTHGALRTAGILMENDIKIYELKKMDLRGATVVDGFPSVGLVSSIAANYLINVLELEQIGILDSVNFPTVSVIRNWEPFNPVRIYAGERISDGGQTEQLVVFISEFQPHPNLIKPIAASILDWTREHRCGTLISPEGLIIEKDEDEAPGVEPEGEENGKTRIFGIGSTDKTREILSTKDIVPFNEGVISGVAGVLLNEGKRRGADVICLLAEAHPNFPDARAAAVVIEAINSMLTNIDIDTGPLFSEAEAIEAQLKSMQKAAKPKGTPSQQGDPDRMYG